MCGVDVAEPINITEQKSPSAGNTGDPRGGDQVPALVSQNLSMECFYTMASLLEKHDAKKKGKKILMIDELTQQSKYV